jgi:hypothetical protein
MASLSLGGCSNTETPNAIYPGRDTTVKNRQLDGTTHPDGRQDRGQGAAFEKTPHASRTSRFTERSESLKLLRIIAEAALENPSFQ